jgi:hypothetical protein
MEGDARSETEERVTAAALAPSVWKSMSAEARFGSWSGTGGEVWTPLLSDRKEGPGYWSREWTDRSGLNITRVHGGRSAFW